jgi:hypothetical protein
MGARSTTRSGQVRPASVTGSTSSAKVRYRLTGIDVVRWVFQAGWPGLGSPDGLLMVRTDVKASGESGAGLEKVVTMIAPGVWVDSRPAHREHPRREAGLDQTPSRLPRRSTRCTENIVAYCSKPGRAAKTQVATASAKL